MKFHWHILDKKRKSILPLLSNFSKEGFYLAGGTGLAIQFGHRDSIDFDFFRKEDYDTALLIRKLESVFKDYKLRITQQEKNTVSCLIDDKIQLSFFSYQYELQKPLVKTDYFDIASVEDIGCMKLSAITGRAVEKDYVDLYFILQKVPLQKLLDYCSKKYKSFDEFMILKSIHFFEDVEKEHILFKEGHKISWEKVKKYLKGTADEYTKQYSRKQQLEPIRKGRREKGFER